MERSEAHCVQVDLRHHGPKTTELHGAGAQAYTACSEVRGPEAGTESPHAARMRKWILVRVSVFCSILTWNEPNLLCRAKT